MDRLKQAREERVEKEKEFEALVNKAKESSLTEEETAKLAKIEKDLQKLDDEIGTLEGVEMRAAKIAARKAKSERVIPAAPQDNASEIKEMNKMSALYSFAKSAQKILSSGRADIDLDGVENELNQEARKEAKEAGISLAGNMSIPSKFVQVQTKARKSLLDVTTEGTDAVYTEYGGFIPILKPDPITGQLGISVRSGLQGDVQWTRQSGDVSFAFETESSDVDETTPTLDNISVTPKRFGGYVDVTEKFLRQTPFAVESWLRQILQERYALTVDTQVLAGDGTSNSCTGILNYSGVNVLSLGSSGGDMTYAALLSMIRDTRVANARRGNAGWLTNAYGEFALASTPRQASGVEGNFIYIPDVGTLIGRQFLTSELIPSNLSEGGQSDLVGMIYSSRWESVILALWGGVDILFDPFTQALGWKKRFVVNAFMDVEIEHAAEFSICKDWDATDVPALT